MEADAQFLQCFIPAYRVPLLARNFGLFTWFCKYKSSTVMQQSFNSIWLWEVWRDSRHVITTDSIRLIANFTLVFFYWPSRVHRSKEERISSTNWVILSRLINYFNNDLIWVIFWIKYWFRIIQFESTKVGRLPRYIIMNFKWFFHWPFRTYHLKTKKGNCSLPVDWSIILIKF